MATISGALNWIASNRANCGIGLTAPAAMHFGQSAAMQQYAALLAAAYRVHPARLKVKHSTPSALPGIVGINLP